MSFPFCLLWSGLATANGKQQSHACASKLECHEPQRWEKVVTNTARCLNSRARFMTYPRAHMKHTGLGIAPHMHSSFQAPENIRVWDSLPSKPIFSHRPFTSSVHSSLLPSFPSKEVTHRYPKHRPAQRVTVQAKGTHIPAVRPTAGSQSRQLCLYIYPHVFIYKMLNIRGLNYSYWSEMVCKNFISSIYLHTH